jgi:transposase-like protein
MARRGYPPEFRRRVVDLEGGRKVSEVAAEFEVSEQTIYTWRRQARIDAGVEVKGSAFRLKTDEEYEQVKDRAAERERGD